MKLYRYTWGDDLSIENGKLFLNPKPFVKNNDSTSESGTFSFWWGELVDIETRFRFLVSVDVPDDIVLHSKQNIGFLGYSKKWLPEYRLTSKVEVDELFTHENNTVEYIMNNINKAVIKNNSNSIFDWIDTYGINNRRNTMCFSSRETLMSTKGEYKFLTCKTNIPKTLSVWESNFVWAAFSLIVTNPEVLVDNKFVTGNEDVFFNRKAVSLSELTMTDDEMDIYIHGYEEFDYQDDDYDDFID